jgi:hypothetical protein
MEKLMDELSFALGIEKKDIDFFLDSDNYNRIFRILKIPKKDGSMRTLFAPSPALKRIQYFINETYLSPIPLHNASFAYRKNRSVRQNAEYHKGGTHFLFVDIHDFFDSMDFEKMLLTLKKYPEIKLNDEDLVMMLELCSRKGRFIQGCVTSPTLSNIYMNSIDEAFTNMANGMENGRYSRYSDDMTFSSTKPISPSVLEGVEKQLLALDLRINKEKTHFSSYLQRITVTGIRIRDDHSISLGTDFKKQLKNEIYVKLKFGEKTMETSEQLLGKLSYLRSIDPVAFRSLNFKYRKGDDLLVDRLNKMRSKEEMVTLLPK